MDNFFALLAALSCLSFIISIVFLLIKSRRKTGFKLLLGSIVVFFIAGIGGAIVSPNSEELKKTANNAGFSSVEDYKQAKKHDIRTGAEWAEKKADAETMHAREKAEKAAEDAFYVIPADQSALVEAVDSARDAYANAVNDLAKGGIRRDRAKAICAAVKSPRINNWVGTITSLTTNGDGKGVLAVRIGDYVEVKTWNNALSDTFDKTLMDPDSAIFRKLATLVKGQKVRFSGQFFTTKRIDCYDESSVTMDGSMEEPEFIFRFSSISTYTPSN